MPIPNQPPDDEEGQQVADQGQPSGFTGMQPQQGAPTDDQGGDQSDEEGAEGDTGAESDADTGTGDQGGGDQQQTGAGRQATPAQNAQYKQFVLQGIHVIYSDGKPNPAILKLLSTGDPKQALANASVNLVMKLVTSAQEQGLKLDGGVILKGGQRLFEELADLSAAAKIHQYTQGELDASWVLAMSIAQKQMMAAKLIDPAPFVRDVQEMNKAEQEGRVDDILPGLGSLVKEVQAAKQGQGGGQLAAPQQDQQQPQDGAPPADDEDQQKPPFRGFGKGG